MKINEKLKGGKRECALSRQGFLDFSKLMRCEFQKVYKRADNSLQIILSRKTLHTLSRMLHYQDNESIGIAANSCRECRREIPLHSRGQPL